MKNIVGVFVVVHEAMSGGEDDVFRDEKSSVIL